MIRLEQVQYRYPGKSAFSMCGVTFTVEPGAVFSLLGPNGAGKTTLIRILSGLILPTQGTASICGFDVAKEGYKARACLGLVLGDERTFYYRLSGKQNLEFFGGLGGLSRRILKRRISDVLGQVGLEDSAQLSFMKYSTGMRKRLNLARALLGDPEVYLLDEPNSGIDPASARTIRDIIGELRQRGRTILLTTHYMEEAERISNKIGFLKKGSLLKVGELSEFKKGFQTRKLSVLFRVPIQAAAERLSPICQRLQEETICDRIGLVDNTIEITFNGSLDMNLLLTIITSFDPEVSTVKLDEPSLEDVFVRMAEADYV